MNNYEKTEREIYKKGLKFVKKRILAIDIGACYGLWTEWMSVDFEKVISIEPAYLNCKQLIKKYCLNHNIEIIHAAASNFVGTAELWNSIHKTNDISGHWTLVKPKNIQTESQPAYCIKLDDLERKPDYIKMDIQGTELQALKGAITLLKECSPVLNIETTQNDIYNPEISKFLDSFGYKIKCRIGKHEVFVK